MILQTTVPFRGQARRGSHTNGFILNSSLYSVLRDSWSTFSVSVEYCVGEMKHELAYYGV
jgi:hypothetical protein